MEIQQRGPTAPINIPTYNKESNWGWSLWPKIFPQWTQTQSPKLTDIKVTNKKDDPTTQPTTILWKTISAMPGWINGQGTFNSKSVIDRTDLGGSVTIQNYYGLSVKNLFQMKLDPSLDLFYGVLKDGPPPVWEDDYWLNVQTDTTSGFLQISKNGSHETKYHPLSYDKSDGFLLVPSCSRDQQIVTADFGNMLCGFSIWDLSNGQPKHLLTAQGFEARTFKLGHNQMIGFRESNTSIELWDLETKTKTWVLDGQWFKRGNFGEYFSFREYIPDMNLILGDSGSYVYAFDVQQKKLVWTQQIGKLTDTLNVEHPVNQKWLVCRAFSSNIVNVHCLVTGFYLRHFEIGSNLQYDTDGFPMVIVGEKAISLDEVNNKKPVCWDLNTAQVILEYESIDHAIHELYVSDDYLVGLYIRDRRNPKDQTVLYLWDIQTGHLRKSMIFDKDDQVQVINISNHILTFLITSNTQTSTKKIQAKNFGKQSFSIPPSSQTPKSQSYSRFIEPTNVLRFTMWDTQVLQQVGEITENLTNVGGFDGPPAMSVSFDNGTLVVQWVADDGNLEFLIKNYTGLWN